MGETLIGVAVVWLGHRGALAEPGVRLVERQGQPLPAVRSSRRARYFSVSPTNFETIIAGSAR